MSQDLRHAELRKKTKRLLRGALKHARAATLAAALVPLGAVAVSPALAQNGYPAVPEPTTIVLVSVGAGAVGVGAWWKRRGKK